jgi:hypothetical protein
MEEVQSWEEAITEEREGCKPDRLVTRNGRFLGDSGSCAWVTGRSSWGDLASGSWVTAFWSWGDWFAASWVTAWRSEGDCEPATSVTKHRFLGESMPIEETIDVPNVGDIEDSIPGHALVEHVPHG